MHGRGHHARGRLAQQATIDSRSKEPVSELVEVEVSPGSGEVHQETPAPVRFVDPGGSGEVKEGRAVQSTGGRSGQGVGDPRREARIGGSEPIPTLDELLDALEADGLRRGAAWRLE